jgi:hypothetical protein
MYPLLLGVYRDYQRNAVDRNALLEILKQLQSLYLRKMVVGASRDHLAAQLCRKRRQYGYPVREIARRIPTDVDYSASHRGPVFKTQEWTSRWEKLGDHYLFMGYFPQYMLAAVQRVLDELDMADGVFVHYSTNDD